MKVNSIPLKLQKKILVKKSIVIEDKNLSEFSLTSNSPPSKIRTLLEINSKHNEMSNFKKYNAFGYQKKIPFNIKTLYEAKTAKSFYKKRMANNGFKITQDISKGIKKVNPSNRSCSSYYISNNLIDKTNNYISDIDKNECSSINIIKYPKMKIVDKTIDYYINSLKLFQIKKAISKSKSEILDWSNKQQTLLSYIQSKNRNFFDSSISKNIVSRNNNGKNDINIKQKSFQCSSINNNTSDKSDKINKNGKEVEIEKEFKQTFNKTSYLNNINLPFLAKRDKFTIKGTNVVSPFCSYTREENLYKKVFNYAEKKKVLKADFRIDNKLNIVYAENEKQYSRNINKINEKLKKLGKKLKYNSCATLSDDKLRVLKKKIHFMKKIVDYTYPDMVLSKLKNKEKNEKEGNKLKKLNIITFRKNEINANIVKDKIGKYIESSMKINKI